MVHSLAQIRALVNHHNGQRVIIDGTAIIYEYDADSLAADNGVSILKPANILPLQAGRWLLISGGAGANSAHAATLIVKQDGTGDFTTIQAAIDALAARTIPGGTIFVHDGEYAEDLVFPGDVNMLLIAAGRENSEGASGFSYDNPVVTISTPQAGNAITVGSPYDELFVGGEITLRGFRLYESYMPVTGSNLVKHLGAGARVILEDCYAYGYHNFVDDAESVYANVSVKLVNSSVILSDALAPGGHIWKGQGGEGGGGLMTLIRSTVMQSSYDGDALYSDTDGLRIEMEDSTLDISGDASIGSIDLHGNGGWTSGINLIGAYAATVSIAEARMVGGFVYSMNPDAWIDFGGGSPAYDNHHLDRMAFTGVEVVVSDYGVLSAVGCYFRQLWLQSGPGKHIIQGCRFTSESLDEQYALKIAGADYVVVNGCIFDLLTGTGYDMGIMMGDGQVPASYCVVESNIFIRDEYDQVAVEEGAGSDYNSYSCNSYIGWGAVPGVGELLGMILEGVNDKVDGYGNGGPV